MKTAIVFPAAIFLAVVAGLTVWSPELFPSSLPVAAAILCLGAGVAFLLRTTAPGKGPGVPAPAGSPQGATLHVPFIAIVWLAAIALLALSAVPLPGRLDAMTGGKRYAQNNLVRSAITDAKELEIAAGPTPRFAATRNGAGTLRILVLAIAMLAAAALSASLPASARKWHLAILLAFVAGVAAAGFLHQWIFPKYKTIWWIFTVPHGRPVGCFVNRTHFAGFVAMLGPAAIAFLATGIHGRKWTQTVLSGLAFLVISFVVICSLSRGAAVAYAAGICATLVVVFLLLRFRTGSVLCLFLAALICGAGACAVLQMPPSMLMRVEERLQTLGHPMRTESGQSRARVWRDTLRLWRDYPLAGVGANGFRMVFPQYRSSTERESFKQAENEYVEILSDGGLIGIILAALFAVALAGQWTRAVAGDLPREVPIAVAGAAAVAAAHNFVDFPLHAPLYSVVLASLVGLLQHDPGNAGMPAGKAAFRLPPRFLSAAWCVAGLVILALLGFRGTRPYCADSPDYIAAADANKLCSVLVSAPTSWQAWYHLGQAACMSGKTPAVRFGERCVARAVMYDPNNYRAWEELGYVRRELNDKAGADEAFARMKALRAWKTRPEPSQERF